MKMGKRSVLDLGEGLGSIYLNYTINNNFFSTDFCMQSFQIILKLRNQSTVAVILSLMGSHVHPQMVAITTHYLRGLLLFSPPSSSIPTPHVNSSDRAEKRVSFSTREKDRSRTRRAHPTSKTVQSHPVCELRRRLRSEYHVSPLGTR